MDTTGLGFPFRIDELGQISAHRGDANIRAKIYQVLLTSPGERVNLPEFGCRLRDLVFDPNNEILAATTEFNARQALLRWLGDDILVEEVNAEQEDERLVVTVTYIRRDRLERATIKLAF